MLRSRYSSKTRALSDEIFLRGTSYVFINAGRNFFFGRHNSRSQVLKNFQAAEGPNGKTNYIFRCPRYIDMSIPFVLWQASLIFLSPSSSFPVLRSSFVRFQFSTFHRSGSTVSSFRRFWLRRRLPITQSHFWETF